MLHNQKLLRTDAVDIILIPFHSTEPQVDDTSIIGFLRRKTRNPFVLRQLTRCQTLILQIVFGTRLKPVDSIWTKIWTFRDRKEKMDETGRRTSTLCNGRPRK